jgi:branched-chain amino acid transport system substrate-binding protein
VGKQIFTFFTIVCCFTVTYADISLGTYFYTKGPYALFDQSALNGVELAVAQQNARGGVLGTKIKLVNQGGRPVTNTAMQMASNKALSAVIGFMGSADLNAAAPFFVKAKKPLISPAATAGFLHQRYPNYLYLLANPNQQQGGAAAQFAVNQMHRANIAVIYQNKVENTRDLQAYFQQAVQHFKGKIVYQQAINNELLTPGMLKAIQKSRANIIYLSMYSNEAVAVIKQLKAAHIVQPIMGSDMLLPDQLLKMGPSLADNIYFTTFGSTDRNFIEPKMTRFIKAYQKKYGVKPENILAALSFDATNLVIKAIKNAKSASPQKINAAMKKLTDINATTGDLSLSQYPANDVSTMEKILNGKLITAAQVIPQYIPTVMPTLPKPTLKATT